MSRGKPKGWLKQMKAPAESAGIRPIPGVRLTKRTVITAAEPSSCSSARPKNQLFDGYLSLTHPLRLWQRAAAAARGPQKVLAPLRMSAAS